MHIASISSSLIVTLVITSLMLKIENHMAIQNNIICLDHACYYVYMAICIWLASYSTS